MVEDTFGRPIRDLRSSVTDRCNFRCPYCMPIEIFGEDYQFSPKSQVLTFEEIERVARLFVRAGAEKIRLTGGEPLLRKGLPDLIAQLAAIPGVKDITLTTNGWLLAQHAEALKAAGSRWPDSAPVPAGWPCSAGRSRSPTRDRDGATPIGHPPETRRRGMP